MGTNYYHEKKALNDTACVGCGAPLRCERCEDEYRVHIGKSSAGWTFNFHATDAIRSYADWLVTLRAGGRIVDEYGREVTLDEFTLMVESKRSASSHHAREYPRDSTFTDAEGHSFVAGWFS